MKSHFRELIFRLVELFGNLFPSYYLGNKIRGKLYRAFFKKCGKNLQVDVNVKFSAIQNIEIGDDVYIGYGSWIHGVGGGVTIENEVMFGPYVTMTSNNHTSLNASYRFGKGNPGSIKIGKGSWLGAKVTVIAGTSIGKNTLVAAQATVTKDFGDNLVIAGVPAKVVKEVKYD